MKEIYNDCFHIPKHAKIREKVMITRVVTTVMIMVMCLFAMGITAYAYFSYNVTSNLNIIRAADFETNVSINITNKNNEAVEINNIDNRTQTATLYEGNEYSVIIKKAGTAKTGFCVITASDCKIKEYHTGQLGKDVNRTAEQSDSITFTIKTTDTTELCFYAHWGTSSNYGYSGYPDNNTEEYILEGETVVLSVKTKEPPTENGASTDESTEKEQISLPQNSSAPDTLTKSEAEEILSKADA